MQWKKWTLSELCDISAKYISKNLITHILVEAIYIYIYIKSKGQLQKSKGGGNKDNDKARNAKTMLDN